MQQLETLFLQLREVIVDKRPFVIYRYPNSRKIHLWVQNSNTLTINNNFDREGFIFAPFNLEEGVILFPSENSEQYVAELTDLEKLKFPLSFFKDTIKTGERARHISLVNQGIHFLKESDCKKVVLSRKENVEVPEFDIISTYVRMLRKYENACVYLWSHPEIGTWMGASPERLLKFENNWVETTSLAGTQVYGENLTWGSKELEEQQIVTDYITEVLQQHIQAIEIEGPKTSKAGSLAHLKSVITGRLKSDSALKNIIEQLHPTPAVCGMPKEQSRDFILTNEHYNRAFYTGFFGALSFLETTNLYVNLRCMNYREHRLSIYVGGGITASSIPEKEWEETVAKAEIMKSIL